MWTNLNEQIFGRVSESGEEYTIGIRGFCNRSKSGFRVVSLTIENKHP